MKQITCSQMGGPCDAMIVGNSAEEMVSNAMDHVNQSHPEMAASIKAMTPEASSKWMVDFQAKFDGLPQM